MNTTTQQNPGTYADDHPFSPRFKSDLFAPTNRRPPPRNNVFARKSAHPSKGDAPTMVVSA